MNKKILLVGTVSNVSKTLEKELKIILKALSIFESVRVYLVESDSTDETVEVLEKIQLNYSNFNYVALGTLKEKYPDRVDRIAYCRNNYVEYVSKIKKFYNFDYIAVADLDGMNVRLKKNGIESCFNTDLYWDGIMANQKFGYYDIYALRAPGWVEEDCFISMSRDKNLSNKPKIFRFSIINFLAHFIHFDKFRKKHIYKKMKIIKKRSEFLRVYSAFGGFAMYKPQVFQNSFYSTTNKSQSEHVNFHTTPDNSNRFFYINPQLINNWFNPYNINKIMFVRFIREFKKFFRCI
jgi:hypothetical protein